MHGLRTARGRDVRRRWTAVLVFGASVAAIAATSSAYTQIEVPGSAGILHLDEDHPVAMARVVVGLGAETQAGGPTKNISVVIDSLAPHATATAAGQPAASPTVVPPTTTALGGLPVQLILRAELPAPDPSSGSTSQPWQADVAGGQPVLLPLTCGAGPCERAFWLIGQLPAGAPATDVAFHVGGSLGYPGDWPSGAAASVTVDPEVRFEGAAPELAVSTPPESVQLGATRPAAARLLELTIGAAGIQADGAPAAALTLNGQQSDGRYGGYPQALLLDGPADDPTRPPSRPPLLQPGGDPFVGCPIGEPCTRHVLVTFLATADPASFQWSATLARADVVNAWTAPADLSAVIRKAWDVDATATPSLVHLEGDLTISGGPWPQAGVELQTRTTSDDPYAPFLPVPGWLKVGVTSNAAPTPSGEATAFVQVTARQPGQAGGGSAGQMPVWGGHAEIEFNPMGSGTATCQVGERCPLVVIGVSGNLGPAASASDGTYHWTMDAEVYPYADVPIDLSGTPASVPIP